MKVTTDSDCSKCATKIRVRVPCDAVGNGFMRTRCPVCKSNAWVDVYRGDAFWMHLTKPSDYSAYMP